MCCYVATCVYSEKTITLHINSTNNLISRLNPFITGESHYSVLYVHVEPESVMKACCRPIQWLLLLLEWLSLFEGGSLTYIHVHTYIIIIYNYAGNYTCTSCKFLRRLLTSSEKTADPADSLFPESPLLTLVFVDDCRPFLACATVVVFSLTLDGR